VSIETIYNFIYPIAPYAPLVVLVATFLDIFFITGLILYGAAMLSMVLILHSSGMIGTELLIVSAFTGTILGNTCNYCVGYWFSETRFVQAQLQKPRMSLLREKLTKRGLLVFIFIGRFVTFTRPLYALFLGSIKIPFSKFILKELGIALFWVVFWILLILQGESLYSRFFG